MGRSLAAVTRSMKSGLVNREDGHEARTPETAVAVHLLQGTEHRNGSVARGSDAVDEVGAWLMNAGRRNGGAGVAEQ